MIKRKILIFTVLFSTHCLKSQNLTNHNYGLPSVTPPSQETFTNSRINFENSSSGEFSYQFPILNLKSTHVTLNYISGVKADDLGSSLGMSWQMNAGGVVSRIVKDESDENHINYKPLNVDEVSDLQNIRNAAKPGNTIDTEYDWFNFSTADGLGGNFYIDKNLNVFMNSKDDIKIRINVKSAPVSMYGKLLEFVITDKLGNKYYFGGSDSTIEKTTHQNNGVDQHAITGWYLYKKVTIDNKETIYNYDIEYINYYTSLNASFNIQQDCSPPTSTGNFIYSDVIKSKSILQSYKPKLNTISFDNTEIKFLYNKQRNDLLVSNSGNNLLTSIQIKNNGRLIDSFNFDYFDTESPNAATYYGLPLNENSTRKRHFLKSIINVQKNINTDFEYFNLSSIPSRFSLNTDYHGYPNGVLNTSPFPALATDNNFGIFQVFGPTIPFSILSANRKVNPDLHSVGNLKKIIHPTKGVTEISYEPNSSKELVSEYVNESRTLNVNYNRCNLSNDFPTDSFTFTANGQPIEFYATASYDYYYNCGEPDNLHDIHGLKITNLTTGNIVFSVNRKVSEIIIGKVGTFNYPVNTISGQDYKVEYSVSSRIGSTAGVADISYNGHNILTEKLKFFGGSRIASIKENNIEGDYYLRKFYYNKLSEIANQKTSIANYNEIYVMAQKLETSRNCQLGAFPYIEIRDIYVGHQNSLIPSYNNRRNKVFYTYITEIIENKSAIERKFSYNEDLDAFIGRPPSILYTPKVNFGEIKSDLLLEENIFKFESGHYEKIINKTYEYNFNKISNLKSYVFKENFAYNPAPHEDQLINLSYGYYENYYGFYNPTKVITTEYFGNSNLISTTLTNYNSQNHNQITQSKNILPDNSFQEITYQYAHEKNNTKLINANMIGIPLETENKKNNKIISKVETLYDDVSHYFPTSIKSFDLQNNASTEVTYDQYDNKGNLLQYTTKDGISTAIIWGYNNTQPIAKVTGATYAQVSLLSTAIVSASDLDALNPTNEPSLVTALDNFRKNASLSGMQISTYTYDPLIGVTSITPPSGIREVYLYDTANRLKEIRENSATGKLLKEYKYNYKP